MSCFEYPGDSHHSHINTPSRKMTNKESWLPVAELVGYFSTKHSWWEVVSSYRLKTIYRGITDRMKSLRTARNRKNTQIGSLRASHCPPARLLFHQVTAGPSVPEDTASEAQLSQWLFKTPKILAGLWLTPAGSTQFYYSLLKVILNRLKVSCFDVSTSSCTQK